MTIAEKAPWTVYDKANLTIVPKPAAEQGLALLLIQSCKRNNVEVRTLKWGDTSADHSFMAINDGDIEKENAGVHFWSKETIASIVSEDSTTLAADALYDEGDWTGTAGSWGFVWLSAEQSINVVDSSQIAINGNDDGNAVVGPMSTSANNDYMAAICLTGRMINHTWSGSAEFVGSANSDPDNTWTSTMRKNTAVTSAEWTVTLSNGNVLDRVLAGIVLREAGAGGGNLPQLSYQLRRRRGVA